MLPSVLPSVLPLVLRLAPPSVVFLIMKKTFPFFQRHWRTIAPTHPTIVAETVNVPLEAAPYGDRVIHGVWCRRKEREDEERKNNTPTLYDAAKEAAPVICLHGYGAGAGLYYASLPGIAAAVKGPVYAIDWLGAGFSSRPV